MPDTDACLPGDFTVTRVPAGYVIGRVLPPAGAPPWWELVQTAPNLDEARRAARELAVASRTRAWVHQRDKQYDQIV